MLEPEGNEIFVFKKIVCRDYILLVRESSENPRVKNENARFS